MNAQTRVFAGELAESTLQLTGESYLTPVVITPSGGCCSGIFLVGVLTRIDTRPGDFMEAWVADPTGMFHLVPGRQDTAIREALRRMEPPLFIAVIGEVGTIRQKNGVTVPVRPIDVRVADRALRDTWIIRTAEITLERLARIKSAMECRSGDEAVSVEIREAIRHYRPDHAYLCKIEAMVRNVLAKAGPVTGGEVKPPDPREAIIGLIRSGSGPKGIVIDDLVRSAVNMGIGEDQVLATVRQLVAEDECYQPAAGMVKLL
jgi:RPA family protein